MSGEIQKKEGDSDFQIDKLTNFISPLLSTLVESQKNQAEMQN